MSVRGLHVVHSLRHTLSVMNEMLAYILYLVLGLIVFHLASIAGVWLTAIIDRQIPRRDLEHHQD